MACTVCSLYIPYSGDGRNLENLNRRANQMTYQASLQYLDERLTSSLDQLDKPASDDQAVALAQVAEVKQALIFTWSRLIHLRNTRSGALSRCLALLTVCRDVLTAYEH